VNYKGGIEMKQIPKEEWYLDAFTWCGVTKEGERRYPVSYGDNGTAWCTTEDINCCLDFATTHLVKEQIEAELKHNGFFVYYENIELVQIKVYPTFLFDLRNIAKKHRIKSVDNHMNTEEIKTLLQPYGHEEISADEKVIEVGSDNGEFYAMILNKESKELDKIKKLKIEPSMFNGTTYLMKSYKDLERICYHIPNAETLGYLFDEETKCFPTWTEDIYFPCLAVITHDDATVYSINETKQMIADANSMLKIIERLEESK
jgi:hypothetical protein